MSNKLAIITVHSGCLKKLFLTLNSVSGQSVKPDLHLIVSKKYVNINNSTNFRKFFFNKDKSLYEYSTNKLFFFAIKCIHILRIK